ncbi:chorismate mutase [Streptomyces sp. NPDC058001]|uniref:chorismate mutase n=1 Tax=Streptomyces sp. NPDC058001 TaxID=3346300 RepID=UPI0036E3CDC6
MIKEIFRGKTFPLARPRLYAVVGVALLGLWSPAPATAVRPVRSVDPLVRLLTERLLLADRVAAAKFGTGAPIEDQVRERRILDDVAARSPALGLDPAHTVAVFRDQIEAGKSVQRDLFARWDTYPGQRPAERPSERPDLAREVRPALDRLTTDVLRALADTRATRNTPSCRPRVTRAATTTAYRYGLDAPHTRGLTYALRSLCTRQG